MQKLLTPKPLQPGDTVAIIATARFMDKKTLSPAINLLTSWGLKVRIGDSIGPVYNQFAGNDALRAQDLQQQLDDPQVHAIWCARGGYGTVRILDTLNLEKFNQDPKWIIGYSDITALHSHVFNAKSASLHATMPIDLAESANAMGNAPAATDALKTILFGGGVSYTIESQKNNKQGTCKGAVVGGNLSVLYSLCGSNTSINTSGTILFIEDLDEYLYHIDRMMQNLKRNGMLENLAGLVVGGFTKIHDNTIGFGRSAQEIILDTVSEYNYPVCFNFPVGHIYDNRPLIIGQTATLNVTPQDVTLIYELS